MEQRISERDSAKQFWNTKKEECLPIRSIKEVFTLYKTYALENDLPLLNEFIFRTYIRKHGYCNTIAEADIAKVQEKKRQKKEARASRKRHRKV